MRLFVKQLLVSVGVLTLAVACNSSEFSSRNSAGAGKKTVKSPGSSSDGNPDEPNGMSGSEENPGNGIGNPYENTPIDQGSGGGGGVPPENILQEGNGNKTADLCNVSSEFNGSVGSDFKADSTCGAFTFSGGVARITCGDNKNASIAAIAPSCINSKSDIKIHVEADITVTSPADGEPVAGISVGNANGTNLMWFTIFSDTVGGTQSVPLVLRPIISLNGFAVTRSSTPSTFGTPYKLIVDLTPSSQTFTWSKGGVTVDTLKSNSAYDLSNKTVNFVCMEATCSFSNLKVKVSPL